MRIETQMHVSLKSGSQFFTHKHTDIRYRLNLNRLILIHEIQ